MSIKDQMAELNRQFEESARQRTLELETNPKKMAAVVAEAGRRAAEHGDRRPLRRKAKDGERFRYPSRSEGARELRRRAQHAAQSLPWHYRVNYELTNTEIIVLALHCRLADDTGRWDPSVTEIANRAAVSYRAVQLANRRLAVLGLLTIVERPDMPYRHRTNVYVLEENLARQHKDAKSYAPKAESTPPISTDEPIRESQGESIPAEALPAKSPIQSKSPFKRTWGTSFGWAHSVPSKTGLKIARAANCLLDEDQPKKASEMALWSRAEDLINEYAPRLYDNLLAYGIRRHGFDALLAVFETALLSECGHVEKGHGYLWGVLRKDQDECRPDLTLSRLLAARRMPGFLSDYGSKKREAF